MDCNLFLMEKTELSDWIVLYFSLIFIQVYVQVNKASEEDENIKTLAQDFFRKLEAQEEAAVSLWQHFRDVSIEEYARVYKVMTWIFSFSV